MAGKSSRKSKTVKRRFAKPKSQNRQAKRQNRATSAPAENPGVYKVGTLYGTLFAECNRNYILKDELISKVAEKTGKPVRSVGFAYDVLKNKAHRSNGGRSMQLTEDGKVKLVPVGK